MVKKNSNYNPKARKKIRKQFKELGKELDIALYDVRAKEELYKLLKAYKNIKPIELIKDEYRFKLLDKIIWDLMEYMNEFYKIKKAVELEKKKNENILKELEKEK